MTETCYLQDFFLRALVRVKNLRNDFGSCKSELKELIVVSFPTQYFNYMGMLATEGTYDKMNLLLDQGIHPVDILLLMASSEGDDPKVEELLKAGARSDVKNLEGKTAVDLAANEKIEQLLLSSSKANV